MRVCHCLSMVKHLCLSVRPYPRVLDYSPEKSYSQVYRSLGSPVFPRSAPLSRWKLLASLPKQPFQPLTKLPRLPTSHPRAPSSDFRLSRRLLFKLDLAVKTRRSLYAAAHSANLFITVRHPSRIPGRFKSGSRLFPSENSYLLVHRRFL